jgi:anti-sigma-K factor RskA
MTQHPWLEQTAPYALGALDDNERASFEEHLATCAQCAAEVRELQEVAGLLATAAKPVTPPPALRDRILADARAVSPISAASARSQAPVAVPRVDPSPTPPIKRSVGRGSRHSLYPWLAAAAAVIAAVAINMRYQNERDARAGVEQQLASIRATLDSTAAAVASRDSLIANLVGPDVQAVSVSGTGPQPSAKYFLDKRASRIVFVANALPPAKAGRIYQLWGIEAGRSPVSLGTFNTDSSGRALASLSVPAGLRIAVTAVTDEPSGGSAQPTTTPFLAATWKSE